MKIHEVKTKDERKKIDLETQQTVSPLQEYPRLMGDCLGVDRLI